MDKGLKVTLSNRLKYEAECILKSDENIKIKFKKMDIILNLQKILENYDELEPLLKNFFTEKAKQKKWERSNESEVKTSL